MPALDFRPLSHASIAPAGCFIMEAFNPPRVQADSPALQAMTDLTRIATATIDPEATLEGAEQAMIKRGVRLLIVTEPNRRIAGVLTTTDLLSERPTLIASRQRVRRADLQVQELMTPVEALEVLRMTDVRNAMVGNVFSTLRESGRAHAMVVEQEDSGAQSLVGIFSLAQIARQLGISLPSYEVARTFAEIESLMAGSPLAGAR